MKLLEFLGVILLTVTLVVADNLVITSSSSPIPFASNRSFTTEKGILLPTLLIAGTLSLFASRSRVNRGNESKEEPGKLEEKTSIKTSNREEQKDYEDEEIKFRLSLYLKLAKLVEIGEAGLRSVDTKDQDGGVDVIVEQEDNVNKTRDHDPEVLTLTEQQALYHTQDEDEDDEYDILNKRILSLVIQAEKALKRPAAEYDNFEHLDDVGSDLEFLAFMNTVPSEITLYSTQKKNAQMFFVTCLLYLIRTGLILSLFFGVETYSVVMLFLMYIVHACVLRLLSLWKGEVITY